MVFRRARVRILLVVVGLVLVATLLTGCCCFCTQASRYRRALPRPNFRWSYPWLAPGSAELASR